MKFCFKDFKFKLPRLEYSCSDTRHIWILIMATQQITFDIPEEILETEQMDAVSFAQELKLLAVIKLYELGRLSSAHAAELAHLSPMEFLFVLNRYQCFIPQTNKAITENFSVMKSMKNIPISVLTPLEAKDFKIFQREELYDRY
jgi:predicted HTH domain antitoxin